MGMDDVAAGEGALHTWSIRSVWANRKSWTIVPSDITACARMPAFAGSRSSIVRLGQYFRHSPRYQLLQSEFRISTNPGARLEATIFQNPGNRAYSPTSCRLSENLGYPSRAQPRTALGPTVTPPSIMRVR